MSQTTMDYLMAGGILSVVALLAVLQMIYTFSTRNVGLWTSTPKTKQKQADNLGELLAFAKNQKRKGSLK